MIYYANPCSQPAREAMDLGRLGCIVTPRQRNLFDARWRVIADNGCFAGQWADEAWRRWLDTLPAGLDFVVAPDVFDPNGRNTHHQTMVRWRTYRPVIEALGLVPAFVCQRGATADNVPDDAPVLFLGGDTTWKLGPEAMAIAQAHGADRWVHMGRVNSRYRMEYAQLIGCRSVDGTFLTYGPDKNLPQLLGWLDELAVPA